ARRSRSVRPPVARGGVEVDERNDQHVRPHVGDRPRLEPVAREELLAHEGQVDPHDGEDGREGWGEPEGETELRERTEAKDEAEVAVANEAARDGPIRAVAGVLVEVLELDCGAVWENVEVVRCKADDYCGT